MQPASTVWVGRHGPASTRDSSLPAKRKFSDRKQADRDSRHRAQAHHGPHHTLDLPNETHLVSSPYAPAAPPAPHQMHTQSVNNPKLLFNASNSGNANKPLPTYAVDSANHRPPSRGALKSAQIHTHSPADENVAGSTLEPYKSHDQAHPRLRNNDASDASKTEAPGKSRVSTASSTPFRPAKASDSGRGTTNNVTLSTPRESRNSVPLNQQAFKKCVEEKLMQVEDDHWQSAGTWIARASVGAGSDRIETYRKHVHVTNVSPFARMTPVTSQRSAKAKADLQQRVLAHYVPTDTHSKVEDLMLVYQPQLFATWAYCIPPYIHYISSKQNVLVESVKQRTFLPYLGEDDENLDADYKILQNKILLNQDKTRDLMDNDEFGSIWIPYIHSLLNDLGSSVEAVLKFLVDTDRRTPVNLLPKDVGDIFALREMWIREGFYEEEDDVEATRGEMGETEGVKPSVPQRQWQNALANLPEFSGEELAAAALACHAFNRTVRFSLWHVVRQTPEAQEAASSPKSTPARTVAGGEQAELHAYVNQACLVCKTYQCFGHGEYSEDEEDVNMRVAMTSGLNALTLTSLGRGGAKYRADKGIAELQGLLGWSGSQTVGSPWTVLSSDASGLEDGKTCSADCFWLISNRISSKISSDWSEEENTLLESVGAAFCSHKRGACAVATMGILDKSCVEIFNRMVRMITSKELEKAQGVIDGGENTYKKNKTWKWWSDNTVTWKHQQREPFRPCNHAGRCKDNPDCSCDRQGISCEKSCNCSPGCSRRFRGCQCAARGKPCHQSDSCDCFKLNRECDPDLCHTCGASEVLDPCNRYDESVTRGRCANVSIQRALPKRTQLGQSKLLSAGGVTGWGLFMGEDARKGEYIGEYVGEIVTPDEAEQRGIIYNAMNLSYLFDLNKKQVLDSTPIGNKLRYINHQNDDFANCQAKVMLCGGVQRIGMFATKNIEIGDELLFNYGAAFADKIDLVTMNKDGSVTVVKKNSGIAAALADGTRSDDDGNGADEDGGRPHHFTKAKHRGNKGRKREPDIVYASEVDEEDGDDGGISDESIDSGDGQGQRFAKSNKKTTGGAMPKRGALNGSQRMMKAWIRRYERLGKAEEAAQQRQKLEQSLAESRAFGRESGIPKSSILRKTWTG